MSHDRRRSGRTGLTRRFDNCSKLPFRTNSTGPWRHGEWRSHRLNDCGTTVRLADDTCVHHPVKVQVVNEGAFAEDLSGQVHAGGTGPDISEVGDAFAFAATGRLDVEINCAGQSPIVLPGRCPAAKNAAVADGIIHRLCNQDLRCLIKNNARTSAQACHRATPRIELAAPGGVTFVGISRCRRPNGE